MYDNNGLGKGITNKHLETNFRKILLTFVNFCFSIFNPSFPVPVLPLELKFSQPTYPFNAKIVIIL